MSVARRARELQTVDNRRTPSFAFRALWSSSVTGVERCSEINMVAWSGLLRSTGQILLRGIRIVPKNIPENGQYAYSYIRPYRCETMFLFFIVLRSCKTLCIVTQPSCTVTTPSRPRAQVRNDLRFQIKTILVFNRIKMKQKLNAPQ